MNENEIATMVIGSAIAIHKKTGPGLLESAYETILYYELKQKGLNLIRQRAIPITWKEITIDDAFRADLIVEGKVIIEIKSIERLTKVHEKQLLTYLRLSGKRLGIILNFGEPLLKDGIRRVINGHLEEAFGEPTPKRGLFL